MSSVRLMRLGAIGQERPVVAVGHSYFDLSTLTDDIDGPFLAGNGIDRARDAVEADRLAEIDAHGLRVGAPIARPSAVVCIGQNYAAHAAESGATTPTLPIVFLKTPNTVVGPYDDVVIPRGSYRTDWEVELAVVIGSRATYLASPADAATHIAGYTISNDVSERDYQLEQSGGQWSKGKCCETFNPLGPWLVPHSEVSDPQALALRSSVNAEARQDSSTADMIFGVDFLIWHLSQFMVLEAGDVINTGTPEGVALSGRFPYLAEGDVMSLEIAQLGRQEQQLVGRAG